MDILRDFLAYGRTQSEVTRRFAHGTGLHTTDAMAIVAIIDAEDDGVPLTPARLAEHLGLSPGATSILLNRLEEAGYVQRSRGHADRRKVTLHSTPAVHAVADAFFEPLRARIHEMTTGYTDKELRLVQRFVLDLRSAMVSDD